MQLVQLVLLALQVLLDQPEKQVQLVQQDLQVQPDLRVLREKLERLVLLVLQGLREKQVQLEPRDLPVLRVQQALLDQPGLRVLQM